MSAVTEYQLHCFGQSGNAYKAALTLALAGADWEPVFVDFFNGGTRTPEFRALNVMGEVPVLVHGDLRLTQSGVILDYLAAALPRRSRRGPRPSGARCCAGLLWDNHKLTAHIATLRFLMNFLPEEKRDPAVIDCLDGRARAALQGAGRPSRRTATGSPARPAHHRRPRPASATSTSPTSSASTWPSSPTSTAGATRIAALPGWKHPYDLMPGHPAARARLTETPP